MNEALSQWNRLAKKQDGLFHQCAKRAGLADAQFWVLYALCESKETLCQNAFCEEWCYSKQTVNTAVARLEKAGLIRLSFKEGSRKQKELHLTEAGEDFCEEHIRRVQRAEEKVLLSLPEKDRAQFFSLLGTLLDGISRELS